MGVALTRRPWRPYRPGWDHDHCEFCGAKFGAFDGPDILQKGWATADGYRWICDQCFADFRARFDWQIAE